MNKALKLGRAALVFGFVSLLASGQATAATQTANLAVSATVSATCSISTTALAFGAYDPVSANSTTPLDGTGTVVVTCTSGAPAAVTLGQGALAEPGVTQ